MGPEKEFRDLNDHSQVGGSIAITMRPTLHPLRVRRHLLPLNVPGVCFPNDAVQETGPVPELLKNSLANHSESRYRVCTNSLAEANLYGVSRMAYVPGCTYDIFISYASENNSDRWVEVFKEVLTKELQQLLNRQFSQDFVFLDKNKLRSGQSFPEILEKAADESAMLIPVLSPGYLSSEWCDKEKAAFLKGLPYEAAPGECLAPIVVRPIEERLLGDALRNAQRVSFLQPGKQEPWLAGSTHCTALTKQFAGDIKLALEQLRRKCRPVFLGRSLKGFEEVRGLCTTELQKNNFRAGPDSLDVLSDERLLLRDLQEAALSVHFIGGADDSALRAAEIATEVCPGVVVLYRPLGAVLAKDEKVWLAELERNLKPTRRGKYQRLEEKHEPELLSVLLEEITRMRPPAVAPPQADVAVICDEPDLVLARLLRQEIQQRDRLSVVYPDFLETPTSAIQRKRKWTELVKSKALLFCWGEARDTSLLESVLALATDDAEQSTLGWYLAQPDVNEKQRKYPDAICEPGEFRYDTLTPFLNLVRRHQTATP